MDSKLIIKIVSSRLVNEGSKVRLEYEIKVGEKKEILWFKTSEKWKDYICDDLADGVIVTLLLYAVRGCFDIVSEVPVSRSLLNRLNQHVIPQLALCTKGAAETKIICPMSVEEYQPKAISTAMSMGVDSFTTFFEYTKDCPPESDRINLLTFIQSGQTSFVEDEDGLFAEQLEDAVRFAEEYHFDLLDISSNIYTCYMDLFGYEHMIHVSTYRNCGMILLFQKLIKTYYYSSSYNLDIFHCSLNEDVTHYEKWLLPNISTDSTEFFNSNRAMTRLEKTAYICKSKETYNYLQVCVHDRHGCGKCDKCLRTMFTLEHLNVLDNYRPVFNVDEFRKNRKHNLVELLTFGENSLNTEVTDLYKDEITIGMRLVANILRVRRYNDKVYNIVNAAFEKIPFLKNVKRLMP